MVKQQIKVVVRTRPTPDFASNNIMLDQQHDTVTVNIPKDEHGGHVNNATETWKFKFDKLMHNTSQENIFEYCCQEAVSTVVDGINSTVMCYGQTAAGKTFTMTGSTQNYKYRGLIPRAINTIFSEVGGRFDTQITVKVSYIEIYNELLFDMLGNVPPHEQSGSAISVQDDAKGAVHLKGMTMIQCRNEEEALNCLFEGEQNRTTADNVLNKTSSRSHAIFTIHLESRSTIETSEKVIHSQLNLVDLAGNERTKKTGAEGLTLREAAYINRSLSYLEQVVVSSCDKKRDHVPYRQCKLTNILKNSIGGNCKTILIANIYPESRHLEETISTLRFASRMKNVTNEATVNEALDQPLLIKKLEREIRDLKQELALHDILASKGGSAAVGEPFTPEEAFQMQKQSLSFLTGEVEDIDSLTSVRQANEFLHQMRNLFRKIKQENATLIAQDEKHSDKIGSADDQSKRRTQNKGDGAGELLNEGGFGLGVAPREAKPVNKIEISKEREEEIARMGTFDDYPETQDEVAHEQEEQQMLQRMSRSRKQNKNPRQPVDKQVAFQEFKNLESESGQAHEQTIKNCRADLKHTRQEIRIKTDQCNQIKGEIDSIKDHLDQITQEKKAQNFKSQMSPGTSKGGFLDQEDEVEEEIIDEEELAKLKTMKELKRNYREAFNQLKELKSEANFIQLAIDNAKTQLVTDFELWYSDTFQIDGGQVAESSMGHYNETTSTMAQSMKNKGYSPGKIVRDPAMDEDQIEDNQNPGKEGVDIDNDALAYIRARKNVMTLAAAKKVDGKN